MTRAPLAVCAAGLLALLGPAASAGANDGARSDAVGAWNINAGKAAVAACISPVGPSPAEARMYAITHVAIHDALNAIDRRSEPYVYRAQVRRRTSPDAAVAAAAHDVLVPILGQLSALVPPECITAAVAGVETDYDAALDAVPDGRAKDRGVALGQAAAAAILALREDGRRAGALTGNPFYVPGHPAWRVPLHAESARRSPSLRTSARCRPSYSGTAASSARPAVPGDEPAVRGGCERDPTPGRRRRHHAERPIAGADASRAVLGRELAAAVEPDRQDGRRGGRARRSGRRPASSGS